MRSSNPKKFMYPEECAPDVTKFECFTGPPLNEDEHPLCVATVTFGALCLVCNYGNLRVSRSMENMVANAKDMSRLFMICGRYMQESVSNKRMFALTNGRTDVETLANPMVLIAAVNLDPSRLEQKRAGGSKEMEAALANMSEKEACILVTSRTCSCDKKMYAQLLFKMGDDRFMYYDPHPHDWGRLKLSVKAQPGTAFLMLNATPSMVCNMMLRMHTGIVSQITIVSSGLFDGADKDTISSFMSHAPLSANWSSEQALFPPSTAQMGSHIGSGVSEKEQLARAMRLDEETVFMCANKLTNSELVVVLFFALFMGTSLLMVFYKLVLNIAY